MYSGLLGLLKQVLPINSRQTFLMHPLPSQDANTARAAIAAKEAELAALEEARRLQVEGVALTHIA